MTLFIFSFVFPGNRGIYDVTFAFDTSDDVTETDLQKMKSLSRALIPGFKLNPSKTRVSITTFGNEVKQVSTLAESRRVKNIEDVLTRINRIGGQSRFDKLLQSADTDIFIPQNGGRRDIGKVMVILTKNNRVVSEASDLSYLSGALQNKGIKLVVVGIDFDPSDPNQLRAITGNPNDVVPINGIDKLRLKFGDVEKKISAALGKNFCDVSIDLSFVVYLYFDFLVVCTI